MNRLGAPETEGKVVGLAGGSTATIWAGLGHELRTPLNGIIGMSDILERQRFGPLTEKQKVYVKNIQACGWQLLNLVNDMVDLAKIEAGRLELSRAWISLEPLVESVRSAAQPLAGKKLVSVSATLPVGLPRVYADPVRMKQILCNLVTFAVERTPLGGSVHLTVDAKERSLGVSIRGAGLAPTPPEETALGLALAKRLVEMHDGSIELASESERGTTCTVTIPVQQPPGAHEPAEELTPNAR